MWLRCITQTSALESGLDANVAYLEAMKGPEQQLQLAHMRIEPQAASLLRDDTQAERHITIPRWLSRVKVQVKAILDPQDLGVWVPSDGAQTGGHGGKVVKDNRLAADV